MSVPIAYFLTWTCYGTWLHGDKRGSVDLESNLPNRPWLPENRSRHQFESATLNHPAFLLDLPTRRAMRDTIVDRCEFTNTRLLALNVRSNHVHLVVTCNTDLPGRLAGAFKSRCTRVLREKGLIGPVQRVWTKNASTKYLWDARNVEAEVDYVTRHQGPPDEFTIGPGS